MNIPSDKQNFVPENHDEEEHNHESEDTPEIQNFILDNHHEESVHENEPITISQDASENANKNKHNIEEQNNDNDEANKEKSNTKEESVNENEFIDTVENCNSDDHDEEETNNENKLSNEEEDTSNEEESIDEYPLYEEENIQNLQTIEQIIFDVNEENHEYSAERLTEMFDEAYPFSFTLVTCQLLYSLFISNSKNTNLYLTFLKEVETKLPANHKIIQIFYLFLLSLESKESDYILEMMVENKLIEPYFTKEKYMIYFSHHMKEEDLELLCKNFYGYFGNTQFGKKFLHDLNKLKEDNWKLHKEYIHDGANTHEIAYALRNDDISKFQEIATQANFNFNQTIEPSLYERCDFINNDEITLIQYCAFFGSIKCFRFMLLNEVNLKKVGKYVVAGGNLEIFHLCEQNNVPFVDSYEAAIEFHRNELFLYLYENKIITKFDLKELGNKCIECNNYKILIFLEEKKMKIDESMIIKAAKLGNIFLVKHFINRIKMPKNILIYANQSKNIELIKYILDNNEIDINAKDIYLLYKMFYLVFFCFFVVFGICFYVLQLL